MKKRILSVLLLLAMVLTMIPFAAAAEEVTNDAQNSGENEVVDYDYHDRYLTKGLVGLFTAFDANDDTVTLSEGKGTWKNRVNDSLNATFAGKDWAMGENGGVGYKLIYGSYVADETAESGKKFTASGTRNTYSNDDKLVFGLDLLPDDDFDVEYVALYTPTYAWDETTGSLVENPVTKDTMVYDESAPDVLGLYSSFAIRRGGTIDGPKGNGGARWRVMPKAANDGYPGWSGFPKNWVFNFDPSWTDNRSTGAIGTYSITRDETLTVTTVQVQDTDENGDPLFEEDGATPVMKDVEERTVAATFNHLYNGANALHPANSSAIGTKTYTSAKVVAPVYGDKDNPTKITGYSNISAKYYDMDDDTDFYLSWKLGTEFYAVRIYNRVLNFEEREYNHMIDVMEFYNLKADDAFFGNATLVRKLRYAAKDVGFVTDKTEAASIAGELQSIIDFNMPVYADVHDLYVKDGLASLFTVFGDNAGVDFANGTWTDKVFGATATLVNKARWSQNTDNGSIGYTAWSGMVDDAGTPTSGRNGLASLNHITTREGHLDLGLELLPDGDLTVELFAMSKPVYMADKEESSANNVVYAKKADGTYYHTYDAFGRQHTNIGDNGVIGTEDWLTAKGGAVDALGRYGAFDVFPDGSHWYSSAGARGSVQWFTNLNGWSGTREYIGKNKDLLVNTTDAFWTLETVRTYGYYLDETVGETATTAVLGLYRDGLGYKDTSSIELSSEGGAGFYYNPEPYTKTDSRFYFGASRPTDFYAVRIYDRVLTEAERKQNAAVDTMLYYGIELSVEDLEDELYKKIVFETLATAYIETDPLAMEAAKGEILAAMESIKTDLGYVKEYAAYEDMTSLFTVFRDGSLDLANGTWRNLLGGKDAVIGEKGQWSLNDNGSFGYNMYYGTYIDNKYTDSKVYKVDENGDFVLNDKGEKIFDHWENTNYDKSGLQLTFGIELLPEDDFTLEYLAQHKPYYVTDGNDNFVYDENKKPVETYNASPNHNMPHGGPTNYARIGYLQAFTLNPDGRWENRDTNKRFSGTQWKVSGGQSWAYANSMSMSYSKGTEFFVMNEGFRTYAITRSEDASNKYTATYQMLKDGDLFTTNTITENTVSGYGNGNGYAKADFSIPEKNAPAITGKNSKDESWTSSGANQFFLANRHGTDFLTVRIYDRVLTEEELTQNILVDGIHYYGLEIPEEVLADEMMYGLVVEAVVEAGFVSDPLEKQATKTEIEQQIALLLGDLSYVKEYAAPKNLTALFTVFVDDTVDLENGVWRNLLPTGDAIIGNADQWKPNANGSFGFDMYYGTYIDGVYTDSKFYKVDENGEFVLNEKGNKIFDHWENTNYDKYGTRLDLGIKLLPADDFTIEYLAEYRPYYVTDGEDNYVYDANQKPIETYVAAGGKMPQEDPGARLANSVIRVGYLQSFTYNYDGTWENKATNPRGSGTQWRVSGTTSWGQANSDSNFAHNFVVNEGIRTYAITRAESDTNQYAATYQFLKDATVFTTKHYDGAAVKDNGNGYVKADFSVAESSLGEGAKYFWLSERHATDFFVVRIYDRVLTEAEQVHNATVDKINYYGIEFSDKVLADASLYEAAVALVRETAFVSDPLEKAAVKAEIEANIDAYVELYDSLTTEGTLYVTKGLTSLFTAFAGENFVSEETENKMWYNRVRGKGNAVFKGGDVWTVGKDGGVGKVNIFGTFDVNGNWSTTAAPGYTNTSINAHTELDFGTSILPADDFTVEYLAVFPAKQAVQLDADGNPVGFVSHHKGGQGSANESYQIDRLGFIEHVNINPGAVHYQSAVAGAHVRIGDANCYTWYGATGSDTYGFADTTTTGFIGTTRTSYMVDTYGITRDEEATYTDGVMTKQTASIAWRYNAAAHTTSTFSSDNLKDGNWTAQKKYFLGDDSNIGFHLSRSVATTIYAVRVYDRVLTEAEQKQNRLADILYYYGVELTEEQMADQGLLDGILAEFTELSPDPLEKAADAAELRAFPADYANIQKENEELVNSYASPENLTALFTVFSRTKVNLVSGTWVNLVDGGASASLKNPANWTKRESGAIGFDLWAGSMKGGVYTADTTGAPTTSKYFKQNTTYLDLKLENLNKESFTVEYLAKYNPLYILDGDKSTADNVVFYEQDGALLSAWDQGGDGAIPQSVGEPADAIGWFYSHTQNTDGTSGWGSSRGGVHWLFYNYKWDNAGTNQRFLTGGWNGSGLVKNAAGEMFHKTGSSAFSTYGISVQETVKGTDTEARFSLYRDSALFANNSAEVNSTANIAAADCFSGGYYYYAGSDGTMYATQKITTDDATGDSVARYYTLDEVEAPVYFKKAAGETQYTCYLGETVVDAKNYFTYSFVGSGENKGLPNQKPEEWGTTYKAGAFDDKAQFYLSKNTPTDFFVVRVYDKVLTDEERRYNYMVDLLRYYGMEIPEEIAADEDLVKEFATAVSGIAIVTDPLEMGTSRLAIRDAATALLAESPVYDLYVEEGLVAHYSSLVPSDTSASVASGIWQNRVAGGASATLGSNNIWEKNPNGSVGYKLFFGMIDADGNFVRDSKYNTYAMLKDGKWSHLNKTAGLTFGIELLPEDNFTLEFVAMFKPIYVADTAGDIARDTDGKPVETYKAGVDSGNYDAIPRIDPSDTNGAVIRIGYLQAFAYPADGSWSGSSANKRGDYCWTISATSNWHASNSMNKTLTALSQKSDIFFTNSMVRTYAITRVEYEASNTKVTYGFLRDGATYYDWTFDSKEFDPNKISASGYAAANFDIAERDAKTVYPLDKDGNKIPLKDKDGEIRKDENGNILYNSQGAANQFVLSNRHPTDFYAVRIYNRVLTKEEYDRNHLADIAIYYGLDLGEEIYKNTELGNELLASFTTALSTATIETDGLAKRANKATYQATIDAIVFEATYEAPSDYASMYVSTGLVGLFTAFTGDTGVDTVNGVWANKASSKDAVAKYGDATLNGKWVKEIFGVGYTVSASTWGDAKAQLDRGVSLSDTYEDLTNFTVETFATVYGVTDEEGNRLVYETIDSKTGKPKPGEAYVSGRNNFRFGILTALGFNTLSGVNSVATGTANLRNRWAVSNIAYTGSAYSTAQGLVTVEGAEFATTVDEGNWVKMGADVYTPAPGSMQVTKTTAGGNVSYNVAYNNDITSPAVEFTMTQKQYNDIKGYTEKDRVYETGRRFSLFNTMPATVYAIRVYDRVLSKEEMLINAFVDKAAYYQLDIDAFSGLDDAAKAGIADVFATIGYDRDADDLQALYNFYAGGGAEALTNTLVSLDGFSPILANASGYRVVFQLNKEALDLLKKAGYEVSYGALVAPGGTLNTLANVTLDKVGAEGSTIKKVAVGGEGGSEIYYKPAGAKGYYYSAAVTADDSVYYGVDMIVRGYATVTKGSESYVVYTDAALNGANEVSILDVADYFVNGFDGDIALQYTYMNSAVLRKILADCGYPTREALKEGDDLTIYVDGAYDGAKGASNGKEDAPYTTIDDAWTAAKAHFAQAGRKTVTIRLASGTYTLTKELKLSASDIVAKTYSLNVIGEGNTTILTSAKDIVYNEVLEDKQGNLYVQLDTVTNADGTKSYPNFRTLMVDGKRIDHATGGSQEKSWSVKDFYITKAMDPQTKKYEKIAPFAWEDTNGDGEINGLDKATNDWCLDTAGFNAAVWAVFTLPAEMFDTAKLAEYAGTELHYTWTWESSMSHIDHVTLNPDDASTVLVYVPYGQLASGHKGKSITGCQAWLENSLVLATAANSNGYYYDTTSGKLYYKGLNKDLTKSPKLQYAALTNAFMFENVSDIAISNLAITGLDSNYITKDVGIHLGQAGGLTLRNNDKEVIGKGWIEHAAIFGRNIDNMLVSNVSVYDVRGSGVTVKGYATDIIVDSSRFENIGGSAIQLASYKDASQNVFEYIKDITITNNYVNTTGQLYRACAAIMTSNVASAKVIGNTVMGSTWSAFALGMSWKAPEVTSDQIILGGIRGDASTFYCYDLEIAYNYVTDMMTCLGDGGAFYLNGGAVSIASNDTKKYNYLHHNYVVMSEDSGLRGNNANGWRDTYCYYFENSTSNWLATNNVLINEVNQNQSYKDATFYGVYLQTYKGGEARNVTLVDNYFVGFNKTKTGYTGSVGQVYNWNALNPNAEFNNVANDYVFAAARALPFSTPNAGSWNNATAKAKADWMATYGETTTAETVVGSIFLAAGSDVSTVGKEHSLGYAADFSKSSATRVILKEGNELDVSTVKGIEIGTVTFTDGEETIVLRGLKGAAVNAPAYFAQSNHTYTYKQNGSAIDLSTLKFSGENVQIDVESVANTYKVSFLGGISDVTLDLFEGDTFSEEHLKTLETLKIPGKMPTYYYDGAALDLKTFKMPAEDTEIRVEYTTAKYTASFVDVDGNVLKELQGNLGNRVADPKIVLDDYHTTVYLKDGVELDDITNEYFLEEKDLEYTVRFDPKEYTVKFQVTVTTESGPMPPYVYGTVVVKYGELIDVSSIETPSLPGYRDAHLVKFAGWQNFIVGETILSSVLVKKDCVVEAKYEWEALPTYTATFTGDGLAEDVTASFVEGAQITIPEALVKEGYNIKLFVGGKEIDLATFEMPAEAVEITVVYEPIEYTVTITDEDGKTDSFTGIFGEDVVFTETFGKEHFNTVYTMNGQVIESLEGLKISGDATIEVTYEAIEYTVTITDGASKTTTATGKFGDALVFDASIFAQAHKNIIYTVGGVAKPLAEITITGADMIVNVEYEDVLYTATIFDKLGNSQTVSGIIETTVEFNMAGFVAPENTTIKYRVNGGDLVDELPALTFTVEGIEVEVVYVENKPVEPELTLGDINGDKRVDIDDIVAVINAASGVALDPELFPGNLDLNGDNRVDIDDIVAVINIASGN